MSRQLISLTDELVDYIEKISLHEPQILRELRAETAGYEMSRMQIGPLQGQFMAFLVRLLGVKNVLEIGTFTGYSALAVALVLPEDGRVVCCDVSEEYTRVARRFWARAGVAHKISLALAPALDSLGKLAAAGYDHHFDFAFIDADKVNYAAYVDYGYQLVRPGGLIAVDNVLWSGRVIDPEVQDEDTRAIRDLNEALRDDDRFDLSLVPIGDGLTLLRKRR